MPYRSSPPDNPKIRLQRAEKIYGVDRFALRRRQHGIQSRRDTVRKPERLSDLKE